MPNILVTDSKEEFTPMVARLVQDLGITLHAISPSGEYVEQGCSDMNANLFEPLNEAIWSDNLRVRELANQIASDLAGIVVPVQDNASSAERYFSGTAQTMISALSRLGSLTNPATATPGRIQRIIANSDRARAELERARDFAGAAEQEALAQDMRDSADDVLGIIDSRPAYWTDILRPARQGLQAFDRAGPYARMGEYTTARISDVRTQPRIFLSIMTPLHRLEYDKVVISLATYNVFAACRIYRDGYPVHCILDEFNAMRIPHFDEQMNTMRGLGCSAEMYVQSKAGIEKNYGEVATRQILDNCDLIQWNAFDTLREAEECSKMLGEYHAKEFDANVEGGAFENVRFGLRDTSVPVRSPQQLMSMPKDECIVRVRGMRLSRLKKLFVWEISGLRGKLDENPLEGPMPRVRAKVRLLLTKRGVRVIRPRAPKALREERQPSVRRAPVLMIRSFGFVFVWLAIHFGLLAMEVDVTSWIRGLWYV